MMKAANPPSRPLQPVTADLACAHCATAKDVVVVKDPGLDAPLWDLWCARCGHEWTVPKPGRKARDAS